ncbi:hypothetical protein IEQ34_005260 [Dendrobium chrysotoxum]|uniref:PWWP domain-containing protein n=1 Tax=Dendrobium chrysotoxum TaxID=161865 RepID=A0AAV7H9K8_DENCH|nr:hypothetical protein IEQ34_005260 [Dendrobium chrysotoxum]
MSSGAGEASGAGGLDLNCDTVAILDNHEAGVEGGLEDGLVSTGGELPAKESGETTDRGGEEEKECKRGIADWEDGMMGSGDGSAGSELGGWSKVGVVETVIREAGAESHGVKLLETEFGEKGSAGLVSVLTVGFEDVEASSQTMNLGDGTGGDQKRGSDVMGTDEVSLTVLVGGGGIEDERLEGSSILRREQAEFQVDLVDGGGDLVDGQLDLEEREPEGESLTMKLSEVDTREKEVTDLFTVAAEKFEADDASNQALSLVNVSGGDKKQGIDLYVEGMVIDRQSGPGERKAKVLSHTGKFLEVEMGEDGSAELLVVSTEAFEPVNHAVDLPVETSGLAKYLGDGSDNDQNRVADANKEGMVGTDQDLHGGAGGERLEGSSNLTVQVGVGLVDGGVEVLDYQLGPEDREANGESLGTKLLEMDTGGGQIADLVDVSTEEFEYVEASNQPVMEMDRGGNDSADLVAVSAEEFEAGVVGNQAVNLGDGSGGDQKQGIDLDAERMVMDGQLGPGERNAEVKSLSGNFLEVDKRGEGSAVLVSVSTEELQLVEASRHPMDFHDGSGGDKKQETDLDAEGMVIDGESGSGKRESVVESPGGKLLEIDRVEKGNTVLDSVSTERFEHAKICSQTVDLCDGSGYDQRLGTDLDAHGMVVISEDSVAVSVGIGGKLLEVECEEKRSPELVAVSTEGFEPAKVSFQAINLVHRSTDDQRLVTDVDAESVVSVNEASVTITVGSGGPKDERSQSLLVLRKEEAEVQCDSGDGRDQTADVEVDTGKRHAEFKSCSGSCVEADMEEKRSAKLVGASAEPSEAAEASSQAMKLADGYGGDPMQGADVHVEGLMRTDEVSINVLVVGGEADNEKMEGSSILREQLEVQVDLADGSDQAGGQLGCGEREDEVDSQEGMPLELQTGEKESADLVAASAEEFDVIEASNQAMNSVDGSGVDQIQAIVADAEGMDLDVQLSPEGRDAEIKSHSRKHLEVDKRGQEGAGSVAVSTEIFEPAEASSQAMDFGDESDGDQKRGIDVNTEGIAIDTELIPGKSVAEIEIHGEKILEVGRNNEGSVELPAVSTEGFLHCKASSEPVDLVDGRGGDQMLETDVDAEAMIRTDEDSVVISIASGTPEDSRLEGSLILRKEHEEVQGNLVEGIGDTLLGELGTAISLAEVKSYGAKCMAVDIGEKGSTKLIAASTERPESVEASSQAMDLGDDSGGDQIQGTDADGEGMVGIEHKDTVLVVGGAQVNERLEGSLTLEEKKVEFLVHLVEGCGQVENELDSHGGRLWEVELGKKSKELVAVSADRLEAVEVSCQAMESVDRSRIRDISDDSAAAAGGGPEIERLEEESSVLGMEHVEALQKSMDGCGQVADNELIRGERTPFLESHDGKLLKMEAEAKGGVEPLAFSAAGFEAAEAFSQTMDLEHGFGGDQKQGTILDAEYVVGTNGDSFNVSGAGGGPEDESLERSLLLGEEHTEVLQDLADGHDQVLDGELYSGKRESEVEPHSGKLFELDVREKVSAELTSVAAGGSCALDTSSQDMDLEDKYSTEQKQETNVHAECMVGTDEDSVVVSVHGGGLEDEMLKASTNLVKEIEFGEETNGTGSTVNDLSESVHSESAGYDTMMHAAQVQNEFGGDQRQGTDLGSEDMVGGTEQSTLSVSVGGGGPEDERLETSYRFGQKQLDVGEDNTGPGMQEKKLAHPEKIGGGGVDAIRETGHVKDQVHSKHMEDLDSGERFVGDHRPESCLETDAEPFVVAVAYERTEAQGLESAPRSDGEQVEVKPCSAGSEMVEKVAHSQKSGDSVDVDVVCDLLEGHPDEREGEIIGDNDHNRSEVNSEFSAGEENMIEKGLACLRECVEAVHEFMDHALDDRDPGSGGNDQETVVTYKKQDISMETSQVSGMALMEVETGIVHHSTVNSERVETLTHASPVENDPMVYDENNTVAGETVQKLDSIPITEEQDSGSQQADGDMKSTVVSVSTVGCSDFAKIAMVLDAAVNVEAWSSDEHATVDIMVEKGNVLLEDNGSVMSVTPVELQNRDAPLNFDHQKQKIDSSPLMVSCREYEAHAADPHSSGTFFMEKGDSLTEDSNSLLGIGMPESSAELVNLTVTPQWNEPSAGCQDVQTTNIASREYNELELEQGTPSLETALHVVNETIDCSQKLQDGTPEILKELENHSDGCDGKSTEPASTSQQATYYLSFPEKEVFSTSDLVWGKVKSHPWWPGQIFDLSGASQLAIKYQKKDHFLVAYFGDKTFAWCEESRLKPFLFCFSQMEKQTSSDSFLRALHDILVEISRRVELSMTCSCLPEEAYADVKYQKVENAGVRGKTVNPVFDRCEFVNYFHPDQLLDYVRELAQVPNGGADRLELTVARAQLKAFYLSRGYTELPAFTNGSGLVENDFETPSSISKKLNEDDLEHSATLSDLFSTKGKLRGRDGALAKQKHFVEDGRKQKSLSELMEEETTFLLVNRYENASEVQDDENCLSSGNKRKALDHVSSDIGRSKTKKIDSQADEETKLPSPTSNSSFKVGEFISRAASKLTSGQPIRKCHGETSERGLSKTDDWSIDYMDLDDFLDIPFEQPKLQIDISVDYPPANEMLSKLCLAARNPMKGNNFSSIVLSFFCTFRNVQVSNISIEKNKTEKPRAKRGRKKKIILDLESPDMSTPDHMKDSYWSDMIIPERDALLNPPKRRGRKKRKFIDESSPTLILNLPSDSEPKLHTGTMCPHVKHILTAERPIISVEEKIVDERTPTAVILYFNSSNSLPSDMDLIRIFSRYGPLKEEETYIERKNNSAMVVFKKRTDAEMAFSSAGKFSTFGPALLSYRLKHFPSKSSPVNALIGEDDATPIKDDHLGSLAEPEFNGALDGKLSEAVDKESSIFVQSQGHFGPVLDMSPGEFSELAQYQVGDAVVSDTTPVNAGRKEPSQDVPAQMETGSVSDHLLLEPLDQEFSYFDLDQAEAGDVPGTEVVGEKSSGLLLETSEVSHAANNKSLGDQSLDTVTVAESPEQVAVTGTSESHADQLENGIVLETTTQLEAISQEFSCSAPPAEAKDIPNEFNIGPDQPGEKECSDFPPAHAGAGTSDQSSVTEDVQLMEADTRAMEVQPVGLNSIAEESEVATVSDSTQVELERQYPSGSDTNVEPAGMLSHVTEVCVSEQRII